MKNLYKCSLLSLLMVAGLTHASFAQQVTLTLQESAGNCGLHTNCDSARICVDVVMSVNQTRVLDSYNILLEYQGTVISREAFGVNDSSPVGDNTCSIANGNTDTDLEGPPFNPDHWRVAGVLGGTPFNMQANVNYIVHTMCFIILQPANLSGQQICVGGSTNGGAIATTVTFAGGAFDDDVPETCMTLDESFVSCSALPLTLLKFDAVKNGFATKLSWTTTNETNSDYFEIQRAGGDQIFSSIGRVNASGFTTSVTSYAFSDDHPLGGTNYYRLRQTDLDGRFKYSPVRTVRFDDARFEVRAWPNPVRDNLQVEITGINDAAQIRIYDADGKIIVDRHVDTGEQLINLDLTAVGPGLYNMVVESAQEYYVQKLMVVK